MAEGNVVIEGVVAEVKVGATYEIPLKFFKGKKEGEPFEVPLDYLPHELKVGDRVRVYRVEE